MIFQLDLLHVVGSGYVKMSSEQNIQKLHSAHTKLLVKTSEKKTMV